MTQNRLDNNDDQQIVNYIQSHAMAIFNVMQPGMTIEINVPIDQSIVVPGQAPAIAGKMFIHRASAHLRIVPK